MKQILIGLIALHSMPAFAQTTKGIELNCGNGKFELYTNIGGKKQATLKVDSGTFTLNCKKGKSQKNNTVKTLWTCIEDRAGSGRFLVNIQTGGVVGAIKTAYVEQEQVFPLQPAHVDTLNCGF